MGVKFLYVYGNYSKVKNFEKFLFGSIWKSVLMIGLREGAEEEGQVGLDPLEKF